MPGWVVVQCLYRFIIVVRGLLWEVGEDYEWPERHDQYLFDRFVSHATEECLYIHAVGSSGMLKISPPAPGAVRPCPHRPTHVRAEVSCRRLVLVHPSGVRAIP